MQLFMLSCIWMAGIFAARQLNWAGWHWALLALLAAVSASWLRGKTRAAGAFAVVLVCSLGGLRYQAAQHRYGPDDLAAYNEGEEVVVYGTVVEAPDVRDDYIGLVVAADRILDLEGQTWRSVNGRLLARVNRFGQWTYGDPVWLRGRMQTPPVFEGFNYRDYLARSDIHSLMPTAYGGRAGLRSGNLLLRWIFDYRADAQLILARLFPDPEASLMTGILLGDESGISDEVRRDFNLTGTTHIIAISGFNITIIANLFIRLFGRWLGQRRGMLAAGVAIGVYTILVGADAAVVRAALMGAISLMARRWGRQVDALASLGAASWLMTLANPLTFWDVSFQLSYAATLGLVLYADPLQAWFIRRTTGWLGEKRAQQLSGPVGEFCLFTLAAQVTTAPIMAYYFNRLSLISFLANPIILPLQPSVMVLGGLAMLVGTIWFPAGQILAWIAWPFPALTIRVVRFLAGFPGGSLVLGDLAWPVITAFYLLLFGATVAWRWPEGGGKLGAWWGRVKERLTPAPGLILSAMALTASLVWHSGVRQPDGRLHLTVLDVGEGEAVLIELPDGGRILIGGGASPMRLSQALGQRLPLLQRQLTWVVLGGTRYDQVAGLAATLERFPPGNILTAGSGTGSAYQRLMTQVRSEGIRLVEAEAGLRLAYGFDTWLEVLAVGSQGAGFLLQHGDLRVLLLCGVDPAMMEEGLSIDWVDVVLLADGGSLPVNPPEWIRALGPRLILVSVEAGNRRRLPAAEVLQGLEGLTVLRTDIHGDIELISDESHLWVIVEREAP